MFTGGALGAGMVTVCENPFALTYMEPASRKKVAIFITLESLVNRDVEPALFRPGNFITLDWVIKSCLRRFFCPLPGPTAIGFRFYLQAAILVIVVVLIDNSFF